MSRLSSVSPNADHFSIFLALYRFLYCLAFCLIDSISLSSGVPKRFYTCESALREFFFGDELLRAYPSCVNNEIDQVVCKSMCENSVAKCTSLFTIFGKASATPRLHGERAEHGSPVQLGCQVFGQFAPSNHDRPTNPSHLSLLLAEKPTLQR
ncbi:hypothetical protein BC830DRAFT_731366 [Chytriomyces sp. MP71]|nr:hypothetical protein BC830DRAFT_731366 [Chytriomyces sp. MP71]